MYISQEEGDHFTLLLSFIDLQESVHDSTCITFNRIGGMLKVTSLLIIIILCVLPDIQLGEGCQLLCFI